MNKKYIKSLITSGEKFTTEFKESSFSLPKNIFETICAFLNTDGGAIILGVNDKQKITGVIKESVIQIKIDLASACNDPTQLDPPFFLGTQEYEIDKKWIILIQVPSSSMVHRSKGDVFMRNEEGDFRVKSPEMIAGIVNRKRSFFTEQKVYSHISIHDFKKELFDEAYRLIRNRNPGHPWIGLDPEDLLVKSRLKHKDPYTGEIGYTLAAILFFGSDDLIMDILPAYKTDALIRIQNLDRHDDRDTIQTNIIEAFPRIMKFARANLPDPFYIEDNQRIDLSDIIFREVIANLLAHREYTDARPATFSIFNDRV